MLVPGEGGRVVVLGGVVVASERVVVVALAGLRLLWAMAGERARQATQKSSRVRCKRKALGRVISLNTQSRDRMVVQVRPGFRSVE